MNDYLANVDNNERSASTFGSPTDYPRIFTIAYQIRFTGIVKS